MGLLDFLPFLGKIIDKVIPDPTAKAAAQFQLLQLQQTSDFKELDAQLQMQLAQIKVNDTEAASSSLFKGGWRPFVGWVCGFGLAYQFLVQPFVVWGSTAFWHVPTPPSLDMGTLLGLLGGMLGLGGMRTVERINGAIPKGK